MVISGAIGLLFFAFVPIAPPRFLDGFVDTVDAAQHGNFVAHPAGMINEFAALPSFHVGWVAMASVVVAMGISRRWLRLAVVVLPTAIMATAVVVTANHYVLDIVAGIGLALVGIVIAGRITDQSTMADDGPGRPDVDPASIPLSSPARTTSPDHVDDQQQAHSR